MTRGGSMSDDEKHATAHVELPLSVTVPAPPESFAIAAAHLTNALPKLHSDDPSDTWAHALVSGFAVEALLKSFLAENGVTVNELRNTKLYGHDLVNLWTLACDFGLAHDGRIPNWLAALSELHTPPFDLRYFPEKHAITLPRATVLHRNIEALAAALGEAKAARRC